MKLLNQSESVCLRHVHLGFNIAILNKKKSDLGCASRFFEQSSTEFF